MTITALELLLDELRHARVSRRMTQDEFGRLINYAGSHVGNVEKGQRSPTPEYLEAVDKALETGGLFMRLYRKLEQLENSPLWLLEWINFEQQAEELRWYEYAYVPGLLQTEAYARAVFESNSRLSAEKVEEYVAARLRRQEMLGLEDPPLLLAIVDEAVLHRAVGGSAVMREQLFTLARLNIERRRTRIHVVPSSLGAYPGLDGPFVIATLSPGEEMAYLDNRLRGQVVGSAADIRAVRGQWEDILADALTVPQSTELISKVAKERWI